MSRVKRKKTSGPSLDDEYPIWRFVYENLCETPLYTDADESLFRQFLQQNPDKKWSITELMDYFNKSMLGSLYKCDLPAVTVLGLYKKLDLEVTPHVEKTLEAKFRATLRIDSDRCLHSYTLFSPAGGPQERASVPPPAAVAPPPASSAPPARAETPQEDLRRKQPIQSMPHDMRVAEPFERLMWRHIFDNYDRLSMQVLLSGEFWQEMIDRRPDMPLQSAKMLLHHFRSKMLEKTYMQRVDVVKRLEIYQIMDWQMSQEAIEWFLEKDRVRVQLNFHGFLISWERVSEPREQKPIPYVRNIKTWTPRNPAPNMPSSSNSAPAPSTSERPELEDSEDDDDHIPRRRSHSTPKSEYAKKKRVQFTDADRLAAWTYVYEAIKKAHRLNLEPVLPKGMVIWTKFVRKTGSAKTAGNWNSHFRKRMCPTLYEMKLPREQILFLYQHIDIEISDDVKRILQRKCQVKLVIDKNNRQLLRWKPLHEEKEKEEESDQEEAPEEAEEDGEDFDATLPLEENDEDRELNRARVQRPIESDEEDPEIAPVVLNRTPTKRRTLRTQGTPRTPKTPTTASTPTTPKTPEAVTSRINSGASGRSRRGRNSIRGTPIRKMPDLDLVWDQDRQPDEEMEQVATPEKRRSDGEEEEKEEEVQESPSKMTLRPRPAEEVHVSPSKMALRLRPDVTPSKKSPFKKPDTPRPPSKKRNRTDSLDEVPESLDTQQSCDIFSMTEVMESDHEEEEEAGTSKKTSKLMDLSAFESEYMTLSELLEAIQETMEEIDDDGAVDLMNEALEVAFRKENWDEDGTLEPSLYKTIATIIKTNTEGALRDALLKNVDGLMRKLSANVENRLVYEQRAETACKALETKVLEAKATEP